MIALHQPADAGRSPEGRRSLYRLPGVGVNPRWLSLPRSLL
ncbi:MAG: hypothetical protein ACRELF_30330 [Gemmataceae bacterium]